MANMAAALLILFLTTPAVYAVDYTVGDATGWTSGFDYTTWVSGKTFRVGDALVFNYGSSHRVDVVSKSDYDNCVSSNALETHSDGNTRINLTDVGSKYFICPTTGHCAGGMKLGVTVSAASSTPPTTPSGTPSPTGSRTPSASSPPPPHPNAAAASIFCNVYNMMAVFISLVVLAFMG